MVHVFLDTNIFLEFRAFYEINWRAILNDDFKIIIAPIVMYELDRSKIGNNRKKADRAKRTTKKIEAIIEGRDAFKNLDLMYSQPKDEYYERNNFDKQQQDDKLLAAILSYSDENINTKIALISYDIGPRLRAKKLGIFVVPMPEEHLLPEETDESTKQLEKITKELNVYKNSKPKLSLVFENNTSLIKIALSNKNSEIERKLKEERIQSESLLPLTKSTPDLTGLNQFEMTIRQYEAANSALTEAQILEYNKDLIQYKHDFENYLSVLRKIANKVEYTLKVGIVLKNEGTIPATDIDIYMHFPDGFELFDERNYPQRPVAPKPPYRPKSRYDRLITKSLFMPSIRDITSRISPNVNTYDGPSIKKTNSYNVTQHIKQIKHNHSYEFHDMFVVFENFESIKNFSIEFEITASNIPEKITGKLNVIQSL